MSNYNELKNVSLINPSSELSLGTVDNPYGNLVLSGNITLGDAVLTQDNAIPVRIFAIGYPGDDTAVSPAGGDTVTIYGAGFKTGVIVTVGSTVAPSITLVSLETITFTAPSKTAGTHTLTVFNTDGTTAQHPNGISYSGLPAWSTATGSLGTSYETETISVSVAATSDSTIEYALAPASTLPSGISLNSSTGEISGTLPIVVGQTTYNFTLDAKDEENQNTTRPFSYTVNPDVVTWSSPANNSSYNSTYSSAITDITLSASSALGKTITYSSSNLPAGLTITGNTISGTPTNAGTTNSVITATAADTGKTATLNLTYVVSQPFSATGGTVTTVNGYNYHTFTTSDSFVVSQTLGSTQVEYLIVAGGGGGGGTDGNGVGGGGAGGYRYGSFTPAQTTYSVVVGAGGNGGPAGSSGSGTKGSDSSVFSLTSTGGGYGGSRGSGALAGGSGGGGQAFNGTGAAGNTPSVSPSQGNAGGSAPASTTNGRPGGGGGGAGAAGTAGNTGKGGDGGVGLQWSNGTYYAGGGGGSLNTGAGGTAVGGAQGLGGTGGGATAVYQANPAPSGTTNTGGGGAAAAGVSAVGGAGGSGIVIIRYAV